MTHLNLVPSYESIQQKFFNLWSDCVLLDWDSFQTFVCVLSNNELKNQTEFLFCSQKSLRSMLAKPRYEIPSLGEMSLGFWLVQNRTLERDKLYQRCVRLEALKCQKLQNSGANPQMEKKIQDLVNLIDLSLNKIQTTLQIRELGKEKTAPHSLPKAA
jgi:hypothetical protein